MEVLWAFGPQTIRALTTRLYPRGTTANYATVQKLLERLEFKLHVVRDRSAPAHVFRAAISHKECLDLQLEEMAEKLCDGSLTAILLHLADRIRLSRRQREELQSMLDAAREGAQCEKDKSDG
jgi:BlaI family transcriptional regulator, penicillinase repressor